MNQLKEIISNYKRIYVIANTNSESCLDIINFREDDLFIIFNQGLSNNHLDALSNVIWFHREDERNGSYFGEDKINYGKAIHATISGCNESVPPWSLLHLNWRAMPNIKSYPLEKKLFNIKKRKRDRKIISPTTGFIVLNFLSSVIDPSRQKILAIGFCQLPNGWHGHDWQYERYYLSKENNINLLKSNLKKDFFIYIRRFFPNSFF